MVMLLKIPFSFRYGGGKKQDRSPLEEWDILPCVMVNVIAMSHFKGFMWVDGWSPSRKRTVVKIPINEGQRNMTWTASGLYLPLTKAVDWNCIPSALGLGSVLSVSRLYFPLSGFCLLPLRTHPGVHPTLISQWWIHNFRGKMNSPSWVVFFFFNAKDCSWYFNWAFSEEMLLFFPSSIQLSRGTANYRWAACPSVVSLPLVVVSCRVMLQL